MEPLITFRDFSFHYQAQREPTLRHIDLDIFPGEKVLIVGASGSGKSTLIHCINGLVPFSCPGAISGSLRVAGLETREASLFKLSKQVGTVLQDADSQFIALTVGEDIAFALENDALDQEAMKEQVREAAVLVDMADHLRHSPQDLSGGQRQRVALAGVLAERVQALLFDEPLANLDPAAGKQAMELIQRLHHQGGQAIVIVEHRLEDALWQGMDRVVLLEEGRIKADLPPDELLATSILREAGIREPLYVAALTYAGCPLSPEMRLQQVKALQLTGEDQARVGRWFADAPPPQPPSPGQELLTCEDLSFSYDQQRTVLEGVSFSLSQGEMVSIVGRNGAGKSTLAKLICGFEQPEEGRLLWQGRDMASLTIKERARRIGYVMQNPNHMLCKPLVFDEVALALRCAGMEEGLIRERVEETLNICGLYPFRNWPVNSLSYGQKKRVTIASVLVQQPRLIILDEPTAGQDLRHYTEIMDFLAQLNEAGVTVVTITHDMHLMLEYSGRALVFAHGRLVADSPPAAVLTDNDLVEQASLKRTSLYDLAALCGLPPYEFTCRFIAREQEERENG